MNKQILKQNKNPHENMYFLNLSIVDNNNNNNNTTKFQFYAYYDIYNPEW